MYVVDTEDVFATIWFCVNRETHRLEQSLCGFCFFLFDSAQIAFEKILNSITDETKNENETNLIDD